MRKWRCAGGDRVPIATAAAAMSFKREGDDPSQLGVLQVHLHRLCPPPHLRHPGRADSAPGGQEAPEQSPTLLWQETLTPGRGPQTPAGGGSTQRRGRGPGPSAGSDQEDRPECSAESCSLQQLLPEDGGGGKQLEEWYHRDRADPDASGTAAGGGRSRDRHRRGCASGRSQEAAGWERQNLESGPGPTPQPREAPGAGAVPAAAECRMDPGPLGEVGEGPER
ncbi:uncharacterized protein LOC103538276 isoform X4 [Calypte anna]|uniref:uncharacterized protein LOC103538276 isoform X4 n=1 Tax=Calypte anna TaxID=9244 RepID=UPI0011C435BC|nr:uncharacterized protein LOC103538276 isoform X4 [Calypte anna]